MNPLVTAKINRTIDLEGEKFTNNPNDKGGPTKYGITQAVYNAFGPIGSVENCTRQTAFNIYLQRYWATPKLDLIDAIDSKLSERMFDWGVNSGPSRPGKALQRALNVLNARGSHWPDIATDGNVGMLTIGALKSLVAKRGADGLKVVRGIVRSQQSVFYIEIAEANPTQEDFEYGWQLNRALGE